MELPALFLRCATDLRHVVPTALHGPYRVPVGAERLGGICGPAGVHEDRHTVDGDDHRPDVVVVVMLCVVSALDRERQAVGAAAGLPPHTDLGSRQPHPGDERRGSGLGRRPLGIAQGAQQPSETDFHRPDRLSGLAVRGRVPDGIMVADTAGPAVQDVPGLFARWPGPGVGEVEVPRAAEVHAVRKRDGLPDHRYLPRVELSRGGVREDVQRVQGATGTVPPVLVALVDRAVVRQRGEETVQPCHRLRDRMAAPLLVVEQLDGCDEDVSADPWAPVVHVAIEAEPMPVVPVEERIQHALPGLQPDPRPQTWVALVEHLSEDVVRPGQLGGDLARSEVEVRRSDVGDDGAGEAGRTVVRGPAPRGLLAQQGDAVGGLVDPVGAVSIPVHTPGVRCATVVSRPVRCGRGKDDGTGEPLLAGTDAILVRGAVAIVEVPGVMRDERLRPWIAAFLFGDGT